MRKRGHPREELECSKEGRTFLCAGSIFILSPEIFPKTHDWKRDIKSFYRFISFVIKLNEISNFPKINPHSSELNEVS